MLDRLKLWQKIFIIAALLGVPLIVVTREYVNQIREQSLNDLKAQRSALPAVRHIGELTKMIQDYGSNLPLWVIGSAIAPNQYKESAEQIDLMTEIVDADLQSLPGAALSDWEELAKKIKLIHSNSPDRPKGFRAYSDLSSELINYAETISYDFKFFSGAGNLIVPSRMALDLTLSLAENLNLLRGYVAYKAFINEKTLSDVSTTSSYLSIADYRYKEIIQSLTDLKIHNPELFDQIKPQLDIIETELKTVEGMVEQYDSDAPLNLNPSVFFNKSTNLINAIYNIHNASIHFIDQKLDVEISTRQSRLSSIIVIASCAVLAVLAFVASISRSFVRGVRTIEYLAGEVAGGNRELNFPLAKEGDEIQSIMGAIGRIYDSISASERQSQLDNWLLEKQKELNESIRGEVDMWRFAENCLLSAATAIDAEAGTFHLLEGEQCTLLYALGFETTKALERCEGILKIALANQGLQILEGERLLDCDVRFAAILKPEPLVQVALLPIRFQNEVIAVIEFMFWRPMESRAIKFLTAIEENVAVLFHALQSNSLVIELLQTTQVQSEELQDANAHLEEKTQLLKEQQLALQAVNEEIEQRRLQLEAQNEQLERFIEILASAKLEAEAKGREAEVANRYKSIFLANMSHELRTPLNSILILAQVLADNRDKTMTDGQIKNASIIFRSGQELLKLINDILDLARIEAGKIEINPVVMDVRELAEETLSMYRALAQNKKLDYSVIVSDDCPKTLETDAIRIAQIIRNIVANAIKFTEKGAVRVAFAAPRKEPYHLQISVTDTGIGIPLLQQNTIFEPFKQLNTSLSRSQDGTGLGLSISQNLAAKLGIHIQVESEVGKGSVFTLFVPAKIPVESQNDEGTPHTSPNTVPSPVSEPSSPSVFVGRQILVVDDDNRNIYALEQIFEGVGCELIIANSGREALVMLSLHPNIDLILMDIMMPVMDGYEAIRLIRKLPGKTHLPIIALTAKAMESDKAQCLAAGASDYLVKPVDAERLLMLMRVWLSP